MDRRMEIQFSMKRTPQDRTARSTFIKATQKMGQSGKDLSPAHLLVDNILKLQMDLSKL